MTVAEINALLYSSRHPRDQLERALQIEALSPGWRGSFEALLRSSTTGAGNGNVSSAPAAAASTRSRRGSGPSRSPRSIKASRRT